ncbi:MAG: hypothetical protein AAFZ65_01225 [Planctomycetota bacterium]
MLSLCALTLCALPAGAQEILWPENCPVAALHAELPAPPGSEAPPGVAWPDHADPAAWSQRGAWSAWARQLSDDPEPQRSERAALAALAQGRSRSAWRHWSRLAEADPARAAVVFPRLLPGVRGELALAADGSLPPLPPDVLLAPAVPPRVDTAGRINFRRVGVEGLTIGETRFSMQLVVRGDGVQAEFRHESGPPATLRFQMPVPAESEIDVLYADWEQQPDPTAPITVRLDPEAEEFRCWARTTSSPLAWPGLPVAAPDARLLAAGLELIVAEDDPWRAEMRDLSRGLERLLPFEVRCVSTPTGAGSSPSPIRAWLPSEGRRDLWLRDLVDAAEAFAVRD